MSLAVALACAGCADPSSYAKPPYLTYEHAFTEAATERARKDAENTCAQRKLVAVRTSGTCTLTRCTTHFHCMTKADADNYRP